jgi:hypothetical protein
MIMAELQQLKTMVQALSDAILQQQRSAALDKQQTKMEMMKAMAGGAAAGGMVKSQQAGMQNPTTVNFTGMKSKSG